MIYGKTCINGIGTNISMVDSETNLIELEQKEISCRIVKSLVRYLKRKGVDTGHLFELGPGLR